MTTLRLAIDAREMRSGAQQAADAVRTVKDASNSAVRDLESMQRGAVAAGQGFRGMRDAIQVGGGLVQTAGNVAALTTQVGQLGTGMNAVAGATNLASRGLLEFVRIGNDMRQLRQQMGDVAQNSSILALLWRQHPLLLIVSGLSLAASVMSLFAGNTAKASEESDKLAKSQRGLAAALEDVARRRAIDETKQRVGIPVDPLEAARTQRDFLLQRSEDIRAGGRGVTAGELTKLLDVDYLTLIGRLGRDVGRVPVGERSQVPITAAEAVELIDARIRALQGQVVTGEYTRDLYAFQRGAPQPTVGAPIAGAQYGPTALEAEQQKLNVMREEVMLLEQMNELRRVGEEAGAAIGSAFFNMVNGVSSARQAVAGLIQDLARLAQQQIIGQISGLFGRGFQSFASPTSQPSPGNFTGI